jgi:hypothetical protein
VVDEQVIGRKVLADGGGVALDESLPLRQREILEITGLEILVAVEHKNGERAVDVRSYDGGAAEVESLGVRLLAEDDDLVANATPRACERSRVDVRAGAAQEVAVPEENLHAWMILTDLS